MTDIPKYQNVQTYQDLTDDVKGVESDKFTKKLRYQLFLDTVEYMKAKAPDDGIVEMDDDSRKELTSNLWDKVTQLFVTDYCEGGIDANFLGGLIEHASIMGG